MKLLPPGGDHTSHMKLHSKPSLTGSSGHSFQEAIPGGNRSVASSPKTCEIAFRKLRLDSQTVKPSVRCQTVLMLPKHLALETSCRLTRPARKTLFQAICSSGIFRQHHATAATLNPLSRHPKRDHSPSFPLPRPPADHVSHQHLALLWPRLPQIQPSQLAQI